VVKISKLIPNIFTLLNLTFAIISIVYSINKNFNFAIIFIILSVIFDAFDGFLAKKLNATSKLGKELDSLSDLISFGLAPSIMLMSYFSYNFIIVFVSIFFILTSELRLARYNISKASKGFEGLPTTASGLLIVIYVFLLVNSFLPDSSLLTSVILFILGLAQISRIKVKRVL